MSDPHGPHCSWRCPCRKGGAVPLPRVAPAHRRAIWGPEQVDDFTWCAIKEDGQAQVYIDGGWHNTLSDTRHADIYTKAFAETLDRVERAERERDAATERAELAQREIRYLNERIEHALDTQNHMNLACPKCHAFYGCECDGVPFHRIDAASDRLKRFSEPEGG